MAKTKPGKKDLDSYTIKGTNKVVRSTLSLSGEKTHNLFSYFKLKKEPNLFIFFVFVSPTPKLNFKLNSSFSGFGCSCP
jgi:hypothetical protein